MNKTILGSGCGFGLLAVVFGAFGAHGLDGKISQEAIAVFETGVDYQMYHALLILVVGSLPQLSDKSRKYIFLLLAAGIVCFSFSLYLLALNSMTNFDFTRLGLITPLGGVLLMGGWSLLAYRIFRP